MATQALVEKLNKEVKILRKDVTEIKAVLLRALRMREESIKEYRNTLAVKKAFNKALKSYHVF